MMWNNPTADTYGSLPKTVKAKAVKQLNFELSREDLTSLIVDALRRRASHSTPADVVSSDVQFTIIKGRIATCDVEIILKDETR